ncbi:FAD-binding protein [Prauserella flavalba]|uniref:FAD-binding protein n=1 Tax=Prauserella flavalba TaxID=1477506 RepID=UPI001FE35035|nr:FAD-binding protein [Prauserella flavalba]
MARSRSAPPSTIARRLRGLSIVDLAVGDGFQKHSYPFSIMVNKNGQRFLDEGADFRNYTYAKYGPVILAQPGQIAWQIFDSKTEHLLRDEYRIRQVTKWQSDTLEGLADRIGDIDKPSFLKTVAEYNASIDVSVPFNPNVKDGRRTHGLPVEKSNWASTIETPPFSAYAFTCGITFTFGCVKINGDAEVFNDDGEVIPGLYACGELVGGIFYGNYPGGSGLTNGAVFGRTRAARRRPARPPRRRHGTRPRHPGPLAQWHAGQAPGPRENPGRHAQGGCERGDT